jgi:hypothetical protein
VDADSASLQNRYWPTIRRRAGEFVRSAR